MGVIYCGRGRENGVPNNNVQKQHGVEERVVEQSSGRNERMDHTVEHEPRPAVTKVPKMTYKKRAG